MVNKKKIKNVEELTKIAKNYPIIGIVNLKNLPSAQLQEMRESLRGNVLIKTAKKTVITKTIENLKSDKKNIENIIPKLNGIPSLLLSRENPFKLFKKLESSKSQTFAKAGQIAPTDIWIRAGPTPFSPGPVIGEFGAIGVKAGVEKGKIAIKEDKLVVKAGEIINDKIASMLTRLNIKTIDIGLDLTAVYEDGIIYDKSTLAIDEKWYLETIARIHNEGINLSFNAGYYCKENIEIFIQEADKKGNNLSINTAILTKDTIGHLLSKAEREANALPKSN